MFYYLNIIKKSIVRGSIKRRIKMYCVFLKYLKKIEIPAPVCLIMKIFLRGMLIKILIFIQQKLPKYYFIAQHKL